MLTPPASSSNMSKENQDAPHPVPNLAPIQSLEDAVSQLVQPMTAQFQGLQPQPTDQAPDLPAGPPRLQVKTSDLDSYDGNDPLKPRAFLSQCRSAFRRS